MLRTSENLDMGHHVLLNVYECVGSKLQDLESFERFMGELLPATGAEVVNTLSHSFGAPGYGFTYLALLTTSHFSIHTWPENNCAAVDIFTCGDVKTERIASELREYLGCLAHADTDVLR